ncbi:MAG: KH domain-containing protein [Thermoproteota archaeon]
MVYSRGLESAYSHPYAVHLFTSTKLDPDEAFKRAEEILSRTFPEWGKNKWEYLAYAGYECLPLTLPEGYVAAKFEIATRIRDVQLVSTVSAAVAKTLEEYRAKQFTLDIDEKDDYSRAKINDIINMFPHCNCKVYETHRGYHIRITLLNPLPLEEILKIREEAGDDYGRIAIDSQYLSRGFGFLTNLLFHEKYWRDSPNGALQYTAETEIDPEKIIVECEKNIYLTLPELLINLPKGSIKICNNTVIFKGHFGNREMDRIIQSIEDNFWEYAYAQKSRSDIKESIKNAYRKISWHLADVIEKCEVSVKDGAITIHVPDGLSSYVGRLIGKQGMNIRIVEDELGVKIRISQSAPPSEDVELKKKLQDLLKRMV